MLIVTDMQLFIKIFRTVFKNKVPEHIRKPKFFKTYASAYSKLWAFVAEC